MRWIRKEDAGEMYCAVHNADCPYHRAPPDQMVLEVSPHSVPSPWMCPDAVDEIAQFERDAERYMDGGGGSGVDLGF